jgi:hypothetical protein
VVAVSLADGIKQIYFQDLDYYWIEVNSVVPLKAVSVLGK